MICHGPAWLLVLCKPCRGIGTPGAQRGLNPMSCCPPDKSTPWVGEALWGGLQGWLSGGPWCDCWSLTAMSVQEEPWISGLCLEINCNANPEECSSLVVPQALPDPSWLAGAWILLNICAGPNSSLSLGHSCPVNSQTTYFPFPHNLDSIPRSAELVWDFTFAPQVLAYLVLKLWSASVILLQ